MVVLTVEMRELTSKLDSLTKEYLEIVKEYESQKIELIQALQLDQMNKFQSYDIIQFKILFQDKNKLYKAIKVTREEIKLRALFEKSQSLENPSKEYFECFIEYWEQKLEFIRIRNGEYRYNQYKPVAEYQISRARHKLEALA